MCKRKTIGFSPMLLRIGLAISTLYLWFNWIYENAFLNDSTIALHCYVDLYLYFLDGLLEKFHFIQYYYILVIELV